MESQKIVDKEIINDGDVKQEDEEQSTSSQQQHEHL